MSLSSEVARHDNVEHITMAEIDHAVVDMSKEFLPNHSAGSFDDPRLDLVIADGMDYVRETGERFDVIISDSTDPIGPGEVLFTDDFYAQCKRILSPGGVMATQNGVPFFQIDEVTTTHQRMSKHFADQTFYCAAVPTYYGGIMTFAWGTDDVTLRETTIAELESRYSNAGFKTRYYSPAIHQASFALPQYVQDAI